MNLLLVCNPREARYAPAYAAMMSQTYGINVRVCESYVSSAAHLMIEAKRYHCSHVATTSFSLLKLHNQFLEGTSNDNLGTILTGASYKIILVPALEWMHKVNHGSFLHRHYVAKLFNTDKEFLTKDKFGYDYVTPKNLDFVRLKLQTAVLVAVDIETSKPLADSDSLSVRMTSVAYTYLPKNSSQSFTYVIQHTPENYPFCMDATRILNATRAPKVMQNGMYDSLYFVTYNAPLTNYIYDTHTLMHSMFPELPRDLATMSGMFLTNFQYWKDEVGRNLYEYNAKDTHNTLWLWLSMLSYIRNRKLKYALTNYAITFPMHFPCLSCDLEGLVVDEEKRLELRAKEVAKMEAAQTRLNNLIGQPINCNSPKQVKAMFSCWDANLEGTDEKTLADLRERIPATDRLVAAILDVRGCVKAIGTYFDTKLLNGRLFYHLAPAGTETSRLASKASSYWCGTQIQNIPEYARPMVVFEEGWVGLAVDKSQSESYCTAYLADEPRLKHTVNYSPDFHCQNASLFFGIPFDELYDISKKKVKRKDIRTVAKRVNHGANYNMGWRVLWQTMGTKAVLEAKRLLNLPETYTIKGVCCHLLDCFDAAYPRIRNEFHAEIKREINTTGMLSLPTGWSRRTFLQPSKSKLDLNAAVASKPQGLSVQLVNKAFMYAWRELQLKKYNGEFRLKMQVHDELIPIVRPEIRDAALQDLHDCMIIPTMIRGDLMTIPSSKAYGTRWSELK